MYRVHLTRWIYVDVTELSTVSLRLRISLARLV